jgi:hypothetical protein
MKNLVLLCICTEDVRYIMRREVRTDFSRGGRIRDKTTTCEPLPAVRHGGTPHTPAALGREASTTTSAYPPFTQLFRATPKQHLSRILSTRSRTILPQSLSKNPSVSTMLSSMLSPPPAPREPSSPRTVVQGTDDEELYSDNNKADDVTSLFSSSFSASSKRRHVPQDRVADHYRPKKDPSGPHQQQQQQQDLSDDRQPNNSNRDDEASSLMSSSSSTTTSAGSSSSSSSGSDDPKRRQTSPVAVVVRPPPAILRWPAHHPHPTPKTTSSTTTTPTPTPAIQPKERRGVSLPSSCRTNPNNNKTKTKTPKGRYVVRGLWPEEKDATTSMLSDGLLAHVFSFLPLSDLVRVESVSCRFATVASRDELWTTIDATLYVAETYQTFATKVVPISSDTTTTTPPTTSGGVRHRQQRRRPEQAQQQHESDQAAIWTTQQLTQTLQSHHTSIRHLTIRNIQHCLSADYLHLPLEQLETVTLGHFYGLTDTHLRSLLFLASLQKKRHTDHHNALPLSRMRLEHCPQLSSACLISIRALCPNAWCSFVEEEQEDKPATSTASSLSSSSASLHDLLSSLPSNNNYGVGGANPSCSSPPLSTLASLFVVGA